MNMAVVNIIESEDVGRIARLNEPVQRLHHQRYPEYFKEYSYEATAEYVSEQLKKGNWHAFIATRETEDVGYALVFVREYTENPFRKAYKGIQIDQICVDEAYRGMGIGKALMDRITTYAESIGAAQLELTYWEKNHEARHFYAKYGFQQRINFVVKRISAEKI